MFCWLLNQDIGSCPIDATQRLSYAKLVQEHALVVAKYNYHTDYVTDSQYTLLLFRALVDATHLHFTEFKLHDRPSEVRQVSSSPFLLAVI
jgi:hypothetical protein